MTELPTFSGSLRSQTQYWLVPGEFIPMNWELRHYARSISPPSSACALMSLIVLSATWAMGDEAVRPRIDGQWCGACDIDDEAVFLRLQVRGDAGARQDAVQIRSLGIRGARVNLREAEGDRLNFTFEGPSGLVRLSGTLDGDLYAGSVESEQPHGVFFIAPKTTDRFQSV
jgi:hypothetical protein